MDIHLPPELQAKVRRIAEENHRGAEEYVQELLEHYVDHDAWFRQEVKKGLDQLDREEAVPHDELVARIERQLGS
jgi:predicted transcriptional regulator